MRSLVGSQFAISITSRNQSSISKVGQRRQVRQTSRLTLFTARLRSQGPEHSARDWNVVCNSSPQTTCASASSTPAQYSFAARGAAWLERPDRMKPKIYATSPRVLHRSSLPRIQRCRRCGINDPDSIDESSCAVAKFYDLTTQGQYPDSQEGCQNLERRESEHDHRVAIIRVEQSSFPRTDPRNSHQYPNRTTLWGRRTQNMGDWTSRRKIRV